MSNCNICGKEEEVSGIDGFGELTYRHHQHKDTKRKYKHYHVISSLSNCMAGENFVFRTKKQAQRDIVQTVRMLNAYLDFDEELHNMDRLQGSAKSGWYQSKNGSYYVEISTCYESDCLESLDE